MIQILQVLAWPSGFMPTDPGRKLCRPLVQPGSVKVDGQHLLLPPSWESQFPLQEGGAHLYLNGGAQLFC